MEAAELFDQESRSARREVFVRKLLRKQYSVPVLENLYPGLRKEYIGRQDQRILLRAADILGLVSNNRSKEYSWSFKPLGIDTAFKQNWINLATHHGNYLDNLVSVVPVGIKYFALNISLGKNGNSNGHYYCSIAKARNLGCYARSYDIVPEKIKEKLISDYLNLFSK